ncbi:MAG: hypothetical protein LKE48_01960 [Solobacterium sp.]|jgi:hypothetical protein|nr:hypothetical protein [Solobacterium sp.]
MIFQKKGDAEDLDYELLRQDLMKEYGAEMTSYSGGLGFLDMQKAEHADEKTLTAMAKRAGLDLRRYRRK